MIWTSVKDKFPKCKRVNGYWLSTPVIVHTKDGRVVGSFFTWEDDPSGELLPSFTTDEGIRYEVTHWMPMPPPPEGVDNGKT